MATVFMKWLETSPSTYDRGISLLTLGRLGQLRERTVLNFVRGGMRVLDLGCGSGALCAQLAQAGAEVTGIDASQLMLDEADARLEEAGLLGQVSLRQMDAAAAGSAFEPGSFDLIIATLFFSELPASQQETVLHGCRRLLAPGGRLIIGDEVIPAGSWNRLRYYAIRLPLLLLTWLLTRTVTHPLQELDQKLSKAGFTARETASWLGGSLVLYQARLAPASEHAVKETPVIAGRLRHRISLPSRLISLWLLFFRIIPPYPKVREGLYAVGDPDVDSPVLATGNFVLTIRRLLAALDGVVDCWLLVVDTGGVNVWCAAGGGKFTAGKVVSAMRAARLEQLVSHHALILPQLCANGVDGWQIRRETGWGVHWGPARAAHIPAYLAAGHKKGDDMRWLDFPLKERLEMAAVTVGFYGLILLLPTAIIWRSQLGPLTAALLGLSFFYAAAHPWLPGRDGLAKSIPLTAISLAGYGAYLLISGSQLSPLSGFNWALGLTALSIFVAAEMQGMSPLMRGEQANWKGEAIAGSVLGLAAWLLPLILGWQ